MVARRSGFSLIELTLVIFVIGLLAAVAAPRFSDSLRVTRLEAASHQFAAHVDYIRRVAVNEGRQTNLICDVARGLYRSDTVRSPEQIGQWLSVSLPEEFDTTFQLRADFDGATDLRFDFEGVPYVGSSPLQRGRVVLQSGSDRFGITIEAGTGRTTVTRLTSVSAESQQPSLSGVDS